MARIALYNLDRPDEQTDLNLKDASQKDIVNAVYDAWLSLTEKERRKLALNKHPLEIKSKNLDWLYREARKLVMLYKEKLCGVLDTADMGFKRSSKKVAVSGLYLSALLNETEVEKLIVSGPQKLWGVGYRLKSGKTVEILEKGRVDCAALDAEGGTLINYGSGDYFGFRAKNLLFVNYGPGEFPHYAKGGTHLSFVPSERPEAGYDTRDSVQVDYGGEYDWDDDFGYTIRGRWTSVYLLGHKEIKQDKVLKMLGRELEKAGKARDIPKIEKPARKVDAHVRKHYEKRGSNDPGSF